jgi:hypothetical protein
MACRNGRSFATEAVRVLNDFMGHLHAARCSQAIWLKVHNDSSYRNASKYGLQIAFGVIALTLRKFEDFHAEDFAQAIPEKSSRPTDAKWLVQESKKRHLRTATNTLIAHYKSKNKRTLPSEAEITDLIARGGWGTEKELMEWVGQAIERLEVVRNAIMKYHGLASLTL